MSEAEIKELVWQVARNLAARGAGWSQEGVVLREVGDQLSEQWGSLALLIHQNILNAWHDLFAEKKLAWGYDLDNPDSPFFHIR